MQLLKYVPTCSVASKRYCTNSTLCNAMVTSGKGHFLSLHFRTTFEGNFSNLYGNSQCQGLNFL